MATQNLLIYLSYLIQTGVVVCCELLFFVYFHDFMPLLQSTNCQGFGIDLVNVCWMKNIKTTYTYFNYCCSISCDYQE